MDDASLDEGKKKQRVDEIINRSDRHGVGGSRRNEAESEEEPVARQVCAEWKLSVAWHGGLVGGDSLLNAQPPRLTLVNVCIPSTCLCFYRRCLRLRHHRYCGCRCHRSRKVHLSILLSTRQNSSRGSIVTKGGKKKKKKKKENLFACIILYYTTINKYLNSFWRNSIVLYFLLYFEVFTLCANPLLPAAKLILKRGISPSLFEFDSIFNMLSIEIFNIYM